MLTFSAKRKAAVAAFHIATMATTNIEEARDKLQELIYSLGHARPSKVAVGERIVEVLTEHPRLAKELFWGSIRLSTRHKIPLFHVMFHSSTLPLKVISGVYDINPEVVYEYYNRRKEKNLVQLALQKDADDNVIEFAAKKLQNPNGDNELTYASMKHLHKRTKPISFRTMQALFCVWPKYSCGYQRELFRSAFRFGWEDEALQFVTQNQQVDHMHFVIKITTNSFTAKWQDWFGKLLPLLDNIELKICCADSMQPYLDMLEASKSRAGKTWRANNVWVRLCTDTFTEMHIQSLLHCTFIEYLTLECNNNLNWQCIWDCLESNKTLRFLNFLCLYQNCTLPNELQHIVKVLKENNTTLSELQWESMYFEDDLHDLDWFKEMQYLLDLNKYGRQQSQQPSKKVSMGRLISNAIVGTGVHQTCNPSYKTSKKGEEHCLSVIYGLLQESPGLWCTNVTALDEITTKAIVKTRTKKRKTNGISTECYRYRTKKRMTTKQLRRDNQQM